MAAHYYHQPLFAYLDHLRTVQERYGSTAVYLELEYAFELNKEIESGRRAAQNKESTVQ